jgi:NarL family two-component system sensor histidine kinase YdfH
VLGLILLYLVVGRDQFGAVVSGISVNAVFLVLLMIVLNRELAERAKAEELAETLESANAKLAAYSARIESLTLQTERQRLARELHDTLAQGLAGLVLQLEAVKAHLASDRAERAFAIVDQALTRARQTLAESRAAIDDLRTTTANLADLVHEKVNRFTQATGIRCELEVSLQENPPSDELTDHALSILSESLANITRHAQAKRVDVKFLLQKGNLDLEVHDDGKGFEVSEQIGVGHYGLLGMRERARLTGGTLTIESDPQSGTTVRFVVPASYNGAV